SEEEASSTADRYAKLFGFARKDGNSSIFAGTGVELMKSKYLGTMGHIAIRTNSVERAMYHLEQRGASFNMDSAKYDDNGAIKAVYLNEEFGGFAVHLMKK
ncbi:MAG: keto-hydroxyglutarate-aldolase/keto-deoxy-phosphogluconate aldolase, partial [Lachnospiraceae bacterium]|nr:keto-hydroxyglutarate-aldolase/keto-deoxy-phosphogluconate aldolase [Lachnospiraceae bacterium]